MKLLTSEPGKIRRIGRKLWLICCLLLASLGLVAYFTAKKKPKAPTPSQSVARSVPAVQVSGGALFRTIRLSGTTAPIKYATLVAPRLRGGGWHQSQGGSISTGAGQAASTYSDSQTGAGSARAVFSRFSSQGGGSTAAAGTGGSAVAATGGGGAGGPAGGGGMTGGRMGRRFMATLTIRELVGAGARVKEGDIVAEFDREDMLTQLDDFKAQVAQMEAQMEKLRAQLDVVRKAHAQTIYVSKANLSKARLDLKTIPVQPDILAEQLRLTAEEANANEKQLANEVPLMEVSLKAQMRIFEMDLQEARAELKRLESNADKMLVRAPLGGIVVMRTIFRGQEQGQIMKGDQLMPGQPFMQIVDTSAMVVNSWLNQVDAEQVRVGAKATVRFDAFSDLALPATVQVIGSMPQAGGWRASYVKQIPILLKLDRLDPRVIPDLSISADVVVEREEGMVIVPLEAVFREGPGASPFVFVRGPTGWEKRPVELGLSNFVAVAVRSGLRPGEWVALERPERLSTQ